MAKMTKKIAKVAAITKMAAKAATKVAGTPAKAMIAVPMGGTKKMDQGGFDHHDSMLPYLDPNRRC